MNEAPEQKIPEQQQQQPQAQLGQVRLQPLPPKAEKPAAPAKPAAQKTPPSQMAMGALAVLAIVMMVPGPRKTLLGLVGIGKQEAQQTAAAPQAPPQQQAPAAPPKPSKQVDEPQIAAAPLGQYTNAFQQRKFAVVKGGVQRNVIYYWFQPEGAPYPPGLKFPLVVVLHDKQGMAYAPIYLTLPQMRLDFPAFIAVPQENIKTGKVWAQPAKLQGDEFAKSPQAKGAFGIRYTPDKQALADVIEMVGQISVSNPVDQDRIYVVGCNEGGTGVLGAAADYSYLFAAGVEIGGAWSYLDAPKMAGMQLAMMHGLNNRFIDASAPRGLAAYIPRGAAHYSDIPNYADDCSLAALYGTQVWKWLFAQKKPPAAPAPPAAAPPAAGTP